MIPTMEEIKKIFPTDESINTGYRVLVRYCGYKFPATEEYWDGLTRGRRKQLYNLGHAALLIRDYSVVSELLSPAEEDHVKNFIDLYSKIPINDRLQLEIEEMM